MTAADTPAPLDHPDDDGGGPPIVPRDTARPGQIGQPSPTGGDPDGDDPHGSVEERPEAEEGRVVALPSRSGPEGGRGPWGRRWVFHGEVETISGPEADRIRAELADVIRDLLLWAAGEATENSGSDEEAA